MVKDEQMESIIDRWNNIYLFNTYFRVPTISLQCLVTKLLKWIRYSPYPQRIHRVLEETEPQIEEN